MTNSSLLPVLDVGSRIPSSHFEYRSDVMRLGAGGLRAQAHRLTFEPRSYSNEAMPPIHKNEKPSRILPYTC